MANFWHFVAVESVSSILSLWLGSFCGLTCESLDWGAVGWLLLRATLEAMDSLLFSGTD